MESNSFNENEDDEKIIPDDSSENVGGETSPECTPKSGSDPIGKHDPYAADDFHVYVYCLVKLDGTKHEKVLPDGGSYPETRRGGFCSRRKLRQQIERHNMFY